MNEANKTTQTQGTMCVCEREMYYMACVCSTSPCASGRTAAKISCLQWASLRCGKAHYSLAFPVLRWPANYIPCLSDSHGREKKNIPCLILDSNSSPSFGRRGPGRPSPPPSPAAIFMRSSACAMVVHGSRAPQDIRNYVLSFQKEIGSSDSVVHMTWWTYDETLSWGRWNTATPPL